MRNEEIIIILPFDKVEILKLDFQTKNIQLSKKLWLPSSHEIKLQPHH